MNYFINLFSPETAKAFTSSSQDVSGFRVSRKTYIQNQNIGPGDKFVCYCTRIQRFIGVFEIESGLFIDESPIFVEKDDPFILRFKVAPIVWLPLEKAIPIREEVLWNKLSFTKNLEKDSNQWTYMVFSSPKLWPKEDCEFIEKLLLDQKEKQVEYPFSDLDQKKLKSSKIKLGNKKEVIVTIPDDEEEEVKKQSDLIDEEDVRNSIKAQAKLAEIGEKLGFKIWIQMNDRHKILELWKPQNESLLEDLPLVFDETTLKTIRNIDVLWIKRRSIVRAFEVEDTTSIFSGILRMADLLALQPMLDIKIHIVAPISRRELFVKQINRPVFSVMEKGPLSELCSFISYDSLEELSAEERLEYMTDSIVDEYSEFSE
ncbi:MAG: hypothetical protein PHI88_03745, partial [Candidatus Pacebacteria bacterium]|nr:hypothetical protein [Candidatus Paceibacterota bacterium]